MLRSGVSITPWWCDQNESAWSEAVCTQTTLPPAARTAAHSRLMGCTMARAAAHSPW
ncbi:Uncharacterised protein [Bordetella pertussis]|nr:Uncharacterised protein [Bordetella pertussis]